MLYSNDPSAVQVGQPLEPAGGERSLLLDFVSTEQAMPVMRDGKWARCVLWAPDSRASERSAMKAPLILLIMALLLTACGSGGGGHVRYIPSPTPHKVVMIR